MKKAINYLAMAGQWIAGSLLFMGIIIEIRFEADLGFITITIGACLFAIVTKIRESYYKALVDKNQINNKE